MFNVIVFCGFCVLVLFVFVSHFLSIKIKQLMELVHWLFIIAFGWLVYGNISLILFDQSTEFCTQNERVEFGFVQAKVADTIVIKVHEKRNVCNLRYNKMLKNVDSILLWCTNHWEIAQNKFVWFGQLLCLVIIFWSLLKHTELLNVSMYELTIMYAHIRKRFMGIKIWPNLNPLISQFHFVLILWWIQYFK